MNSNKLNIQIMINSEDLIQFSPEQLESLFIGLTELSDRAAFEPEQSSMSNAFTDMFQADPEGRAILDSHMSDQDFEGEE